MKKVQLGDSDVSVTPVTFGAWAIGGWMWGGADKKKQVIENAGAMSLVLSENELAKMNQSLSKLSLEL